MGAVQGGTLSDALVIQGLTVRFGDVTVLDRLDLTVRRGELFVLLGSSGSGKTTLLRAIAGFVRPDRGAIRLEGADLGPLPPHRRPVNTVFQSGALFPHLSVAANIGFGPRQRGVPRDEVAWKVRALLSLVRLDGFETRRPLELSGGQRQRVALARGLAADPALLLLDEPLSALDRGLRASTAAELSRLQKTLGTTFILVTHDQTEALTMATRVGVMQAGRMAQVGSPREIYEAPVSRFVAEFMGVENFLDAVISEDGLRASVSGVNIPLATGAPPGPASLAIRAERVMLAHDVQIQGQIGDQIGGMIGEVIYAGGTEICLVTMTGGATVRVAARGWAVGQGVMMTFPPGACLVFPR